MEIYSPFASVVFNPRSKKGGSTNKTPMVTQEFQVPKMEESSTLLAILGVEKLPLHKPLLIQLIFHGFRINPPFKVPYEMVKGVK